MSINESDHHAFEDSLSAGSSRTFRPASFWKRFLAGAIDYGILLAATIVIGLSNVVAQSLSAGGAVHAAVFLSHAILSAVTLFSFYFLYFILFETSRFQATPGKLILGLVVLNRTGKTIGFFQEVFKVFLQKIVLVWAMAITAITSLVLHLGVPAEFSVGISEISLVAIIVCIPFFRDRTQSLLDLVANRLVVEKASLSGSLADGNKSFLEKRQTSEALTKVSIFAKWATRLTAGLLLVATTGLTLYLAAPKFPNLLRSLIMVESALRNETPENKDETDRKLAEARSISPSVGPLYYDLATATNTLRLKGPTLVLMNRQVRAGDPNDRVINLLAEARDLLLYRETRRAYEVFAEARDLRIAKPPAKHDTRAILADSVMVNDMLRFHDYHNAESLATALIELKDNYPSLYILRARARKALGDEKGHEQDMKMVEETKREWQWDLDNRVPTVGWLRKQGRLKEITDEQGRIPVVRAARDLSTHEEPTAADLYLDLVEPESINPQDLNNAVYSLDIAKGRSNLFGARKGQIINGSWLSPRSEALPALKFLYDR